MTLLHGWANSDVDAEKSPPAASVLLRSRLADYDNVSWFTSAVFMRTYDNTRYRKQNFDDPISLHKRNDFLFPYGSSGLSFASGCLLSNLAITRRRFL